MKTVYVCTIYLAGWASDPVWLVTEIFVPTDFRTPERPVRNESLYRPPRVQHYLLEILRYNFVRP
jgi:hypothetical protein